MKISASWLKREIAFGLVIMLAIPLAEAAAQSPHESVSGQPVESAPIIRSGPRSSTSQTVKVEPGTSESDSTLPDSPPPAQSQSASLGGQLAKPQSEGDQKGDATPKPVGSAVAPFEKTTGVAASRPAGAVIAPGKQRRARSIVIRMSIAVGAAVAIGTVVALSHGSSSRPN